jgi:hypothetical protein
VSEGTLDFALFKVTKSRLVVSLIMPHIEYGSIIYAIADAASQRRLNITFRACSSSLRRLDHGDKCYRRFAG